MESAVDCIVGCVEDGRWMTGKNCARDSDRKMFDVVDTVE